MVLFLERVTRLELASLTLKKLSLFQGTRTSDFKSPYGDKNGGGSVFASHILLQKKRAALWRLFSFGAGYEARTRYLHLGKVALYQMS